MKLDPQANLNMEAQRIKIAKINLRRIRWGKGNLLDQMYQEFIELQKIRLWYWHGKSQINSSNMIENPQTDALYVKLNYDQVYTTHEEKQDHPLSGKN